MHYTWLDQVWTYIIEWCGVIVHNAVMVIIVAILLGFLWSVWMAKVSDKKSNWGTRLWQAFLSLAFLVLVVAFSFVVVAYERHVSFDDLHHKYVGDLSRVGEISHVFSSGDDNVQEETGKSGTTKSLSDSTVDTLVSRAFHALPIEVINPPYRTSVSTNPNAANVQIKGRASKIQDVSIGQLHLFVDYNQWSGNGKVPCRFAGPDDISLLSISPNQAEIVIDTSWADRAMISYEVHSSSAIWDLVFLATLLLFGFPIWKNISVWRWDRPMGFLIIVLYILLYITLRSWLNGSYEAGFWVVGDLIQFIIVGGTAILAYRHLRDMLARDQCAVTLDPVTKDSIQYKEAFFFKLGIATYLIFLFSLFTLVLFPLGILSLGGSWKVRISLLILSLVLTGVSRWFSRLEMTEKLLKKLKNSDKVKIRLQAWYLPASSAIVGLLGLVWPGVWLFAMLLLLMVLCWLLGAVTQVSIAHKMVIVLFGKDRYHWMFTFGTCKDSILRDGLNIMSLPVWFPGLKFYVFRKEILEIDKFKIADRLPTSTEPCQFEQDTATGKWIEKRRQDDNLPAPGPTVEYFVNIRARTFVDPELFLRLSDEDRANYQAMIQRVAQNMLGRLTRRLNLNQALTGGYAVSNHHCFHLEGFETGGKGITFKEALDIELMKSIGFNLTSLEISDANPPADLEQSQVDLERARVELATERVKAEMQVVRVKAEGTALAAKIEEIQKAMANATSAADLLALLEFAKSPSNIVLPTSLLDNFGNLAKAATKLSKLSE